MWLSPEISRSSMTLSLADGSCLDAVILLLNPAREQGEQGPVAPVAHEIERALAVPAPEGRIRSVAKQFSPALEELHRALVLQGRRAGLEGAEVATVSGARVLLPGVETVPAGGQLSDHGATPSSGWSGGAVQVTVLHDHPDRAGVLQDGDVGEGVAVDQEQVGERARPAHAQLPRQAHDLAALPGGRHERLHRREAEDLDEQPEIAGVRAVRAERESVVAAGQDADAAGAHPGDALHRRGQLPLELPRARRRHAPLAAGL